MKQQLISLLQFAPDLSHNLALPVHNANSINFVRPVLLHGELKIHFKGEYMPFERLPEIRFTELQNKINALIA